MKCRQLILSGVLALVMIMVPVGMQSGDLARAALSIPQAATLLGIQMVGHIGGSTGTVYLQGSYAYIGEGTALAILDVSQPASPVVVGKTLPLSDYVADVFVDESYAYVAAGASGLWILNVSDPTQPTEVGTLDTSAASGVMVVGNYAYVADGYFGGLRVIDISDPTNPMEVGAYDTQGFAVDVVVVGSYAYLADGAVFSGGQFKGGGLRVIDVSDPTTPTEISFYDTPGHITPDLVVVGDYAYIADGSGGLRIIDISDPAQPTETSFYETPGGASGVFVSGDYAFVAESPRWDGSQPVEGGLRIIDVSDSTAPTQVGFCDTPDFAASVAVFENNAFVADDLYGLRVIDVTNPTSPVELGAYNTLGYAQDIAIVGNHAYVADGNIGLYYDAGLQVVDISDPARPRQAGFYDSPSYACGVTTSGSYAYVADYESGLQVVDISNPTNPMQVGSYDTPSLAYDVAAVGNYAYVADGESELQIIDVSSPADPVQVGACSPSGLAYAVAIVGNYAYVANRAVWDGDQYVRGGLQVIDVSDPTHPTEVGFYDPHEAGHMVDVTVVDDYAYVVGWDSDLRIIDVSDPSQPTGVGLFDTPGSDTGVAVVGSYAYVTDRDSGLWIIDVSDPAAPTEAGFYDVLGNSYGLTVDRDYVYVVGSTGLTILKITTSALQVTPSTLTFLTEGDGTVLIPRRLEVESTSDDFAWTATMSPTVAWLDLDPISGTTPAAITVTANISGLTAVPGPYITHIVVEAEEGVMNSPQTIPVQVIIAERIYTTHLPLVLKDH